MTTKRQFSVVGALFLALALMRGAGAEAALPVPVTRSLHDARASSSTPVAVFGSDDRTAIPQKLHWVAERTGLLFNNRSRTVCSAFCVADNLIATAAHCMARGQAPGTVRYDDFNFARNYDRSRDFVKVEGAANGAASQHILTGDFRLKIRPPIDAAHDWALVRVPRKTCPTKSLDVKVLSNEEIITEAEAGRIFQVSYHRDFPAWRPAYSKPCAVARDYDAAKWSAIAPDFMSPEQMILHTCDTGGASSGSPLLLETSQGPVVVGINVGTYVQSIVPKPKDDADKPTGRLSEIVANTAVNAGAFAHHIEPLRNAQILSTTAGLRDLQERLRSQNLYGGRLDGVYGPALKAAIEAYEQAIRLPSTGLPTRSLVVQLAQDALRGGQVAPTSMEQSASGR